MIPDDLPADAEPGGDGRLRRARAHRPRRRAVRRAADEPTRRSSRSSAGPASPGSLTPGRGRERRRRPHRRRRPARAARPRCCATAGLADDVVVADARDPIALRDAVDAPPAARPTSPSSASTSPGCEGGAILATAERGTVIFFSTDHGDVGRRAQRALDRRGQRHRVAGVGERDLVGEAGLAQQVGLGLDRHDPDVCAAPARRAAASDSEPLLPAPPITATDGPRARTPPPPGRSAPARRRRPSPPSPARPGRSSGMRGGDRAAEQDRVPSAGTCSERPSQRASPSVITQRRQRQGHQGGDPVAHLQARAATPGRPRRRRRRACRRSRSPGSASCRGPRRSRAPPARTASPSPSCLAASWRNDAASRLSRSTRIRTSSGQSSRRVSSRSAACGSTPAGASTRCRPDRRRRSRGGPSASDGAVGRKSYGAALA